MKRNGEGVGGRQQDKSGVQKSKTRVRFPNPSCRIAYISSVRQAMGRTEANRCVGIAVLRWSPVSDPRIVSSQDSWVILSPKTIAST